MPVINANRVFEILENPLSAIVELDFDLTFYLFEYPLGNADSPWRGGRFQARRQIHAIAVNFTPIRV